jgi:hypothetical protein
MAVALKIVFLVWGARARCSGTLREPAGPACRKLLSDIEAHAFLLLSRCAIRRQVCLI